MPNAKLRFAMSITSSTDVQVTIGNTPATQIGHAPMRLLSTLVGLDDSDVVVDSQSADDCRKAAKAFLKARIPGMWNLGDTAENTGHKIRDGGWSSQAVVFAHSFPLLAYSRVQEDYAELPVTIAFGAATLRVRYFVVVQDS